MSPSIQASALSIGYGEGKQSTLLHSGINLQLRQGELVCLLGPNGAGKSTLLRTICGMQNSLSGTVEIFNQPLNKLSARQLSLKVGMVLTEKTFEGMRVIDLVSLGRYPHTGFFARLGRHDYRIVLKALHDTGLEKYQDRLVSQLSDGEQQRAMIARVLAQETPIIILDEPTAFLDLPGRYEVFQLLQDLCVQQQKSILLSTHDLDLALKLSDRLWLIGKDKPFVCGLPEDLVLQGCIADFFNNQRLQFDVNTGSFEGKKPMARKLLLRGKNPEAFWVSRALWRKGFETERHNLHQEPDIVVEGKENYLLNHAGKQFNYKTIETMLDFITSHSIIRTTDLPALKQSAVLN